MLECVLRRRRSDLRQSVLLPNPIFTDRRIIEPTACRRLALAVALLLPLCGMASSASAESDLETAEKLATLLRSARTVISANQDLINDATIVDKGLTGDVVVRKAAKLFLLIHESPLTDALFLLVSKSDEVTTT